MRRYILLLMLAATGVSAAPRNGLYTEEQARAGGEIYSQRCAMCHGKMLEGTFEIPALQGRFVAHWSNAPLSMLYDYIGRAMPQFAPGSLTPDENAKVMAFLLQQNGQPSGSDTLPASSSALQAVKLGKGGGR